MRACSSSTDMGSRSCLASSTRGSPGLLGKRSSKSTPRIVDPYTGQVNKPRVADVPSSIRAGIGDGSGGLKLVDRPVPQPAAGEVLIKVGAAGVNRPDVLQRRGMSPPPPGAPDILGLEVAGQVVSTGGETAQIIGQRVCALIAGGGYAEYCVAP